ncbi:unnamed protein product [Triticum turgidum subsp. durum]|uniref:Uncharacterized protein n=1 Tax=Triticum turgidum subsp. durum TaxID=4567 RepID=A0A9R1ARD1_TRITD|nr:unnamed protein product [Triticum turgidum subsp. durum]
MVQSACAKHVVFGIPTPPNSGSELSSRKMIFAAMLESTTGSKRQSPDDQDLVLSMNSTSTESLEVRDAMDVSVNCKRVCVERVGTRVGIDGSTFHVTEEVDGGVEVDQDKRREYVGDGKDVGDNTKEATGPGAAGQLTGEHDVARQEP